jgi:hypothetical protein
MKRPNAPQQGVPHDTHDLAPPDRTRSNVCHAYAVKKKYVDRSKVLVMHMSELEEGDLRSTL